MADIVNIDKFISEYKCQEVTNPKMFENEYGNDIKPTKDGLFSYDIFGPKHTELRNTKWGYINLGTEIIHPVALDLLDNISGAFRKMALRKIKYKLDNGALVPDQEKGRWGVSYIKEILNKIDWTKISNYEKKKQKIEKIKKLHNNGTMYINKWLVIPAGVRDFSVKNGRVVYDEVNDLYKALLTTVSGKTSDKYANYLLGNQDLERAVSRETIIQKQVNDIHDYFINRLSGKNGLVRGALIKKRVDFAARLVASALPEIPPLSATVPWGALLNLFMPFVVHEIEKNPELKKMLFGTSEYISVDDYSNLFQYIFRNMETVSREKPQAKNKLIEILRDQIEKNDLKVEIKRDPAFGDVSHWVCYPIIDTRDVYNIGMNSLYYSPIGGDSMENRSVIYYNGGLKLNGNIIKFENDVWGRFGALQMHYNKFFKK